MFAALLAPNAVFGVADERRAPNEPTTPKPSKPVTDEAVPDKGKDDERILVDVLDGVRFVTAAKDIVTQDLDLLGLDLKAVPSLDSPAFRKKIVAFLGQPVSLASIRKMAQVTIERCQETGRPFVNVTIPEQDITSGVIHILVTESRLGEIRVEGNKYWARERYLKAFHAREEGLIDEERLLGDLNRFNANAFRRVKPIFTAGKEPDTTDLILRAEERFPVRFYTGYEDTGTQSTGLDRLMAGFNWGDGFFKDHEIGYQYATDIDIDRLQSHSGYWRIPLPDRHQLAFSGGYSETRATLTDELVSPAVNWQASMRYSIPLKEFETWHHQLDLGFDFKQTESNLEFGGQQVFSSSVDTAQFALGYGGGASDRWGSTDYSLTGVFSPGQLTPHQQIRDYTSARAGTDPRYVYGRWALERNWNLPKGCSISNRLSGQVAANRLQSTEQMLLGGVNSVRGYDDRLVAGDEGVQINVEFRSPDFELGRLGGSDRFDNHLQFLLFYDYGWGRNKGSFAGEVKNQYLNSVGAGARYRLGTHVDLGFHYGRALNALKGGVMGSDHGRIHLGVVVSF